MLNVYIIYIDLRQQQLLSVGLTNKNRLMETMTTLIELVVTSFKELH